jgi:hypothetical protein
LQARAVEVAAVLGKHGGGKAKWIQHGGRLAVFDHTQIEALLQRQEQIRATFLWLVTGRRANRTKKITKKKYF